MNDPSTLRAQMATPFFEHLRHASVRLLPPAMAQLAFETPQWVLVHAFAPGLIEYQPPRGAWGRIALPCSTTCVLAPESLVRLLDDLPCEWLVIGIQDAYLAEFRARDPSLAGPQLAECRMPMSDDGVSGVCKEMRRLILSGYLCEAGYLGALVDAITVRMGVLLQQPLASPAAGDHLSPVKLRRALRLIEEHLADDCSVEDLARSVGLSRAHFSRAFKQETGTTPSQYILLRKVIRARELLCDASLPLSQVAQMAGFSSQAHLSTVFKTQFGVTPGRYRYALAATGRS